MSSEEDLAPVKILLYSDDRTVREQVRFALGRRLASDLGELDIVECATQPAVIRAVDGDDYDLLILDGDATPSGGFGVSYQLKNEVADCPPVLLLVSRSADGWLASWSLADAVSAYPVDPVRLPAEVADVLRTHRRGESGPAGVERVKRGTTSNAALGVGVH